MKHKRLNRDGWGFQYYPYYQMRIDEDFFHGMACLIRLTEEQHKSALAEGDAILKELCSDINETNELCGKVRRIVEQRISDGEPIRKCKEVLELESTQGRQIS